LANATPVPERLNFQTKMFRRLDIRKWFVLFRFFSASSGQRKPLHANS